MFKKVLLRRVVFHESVDKNLPTFDNEELSIICDVCNCFNLTKTVNIDDYLSFDARCMKCREYDATIQQELDEIIRCVKIPTQITLVGGLRRYYLEKHGFIEEKL